jgi:hypothetical protein
MREFSNKEQQIIRDKLITGTTLPGLFSTSFLENGKLMIQINASGHHRFEFFSDTIPARQANEELVDVINLLKYLDGEGLITKYPPAATTLRDFDEDQQISIGHSESKKSETFLLIRQSKSLVKFLKENDNYFFQANEPLRVLVANNFRTLQERQFERTSSTTLRGQWISIGVAGLTLLITLVINIVNWKRSDRAEKAMELVVIDLQHKISHTKTADSIAHLEFAKQIDFLKNQIDSLKTGIKTITKMKNNPARKKVKPS